MGPQNGTYCILNKCISTVNTLSTMRGSDRERARSTAIFTQNGGLAMGSDTLLFVAASARSLVRPLEVSLIAIEIQKKAKKSKKEKEVGSMYEMKGNAIRRRMNEKEFECT